MPNTLKTLQGSLRGARSRHGAYRSSPWRVVYSAAACALSMLVSSAFLFSAPALAVTWPADSPRLSIGLGFHETYTAGVSNRNYLHSGLDATASAGSQILSPIAATVCFAGSIPSGDSSVDDGGAGETAQGVSLAMEDGRTLTLLPFEDICVQAGQAVDEGQVLGTLAASGDRSSSEPHLHIGLKRGRTYYDPAQLFGVEVSESAPQAQYEQAAALGEAGGSEEYVSVPAYDEEVELGEVSEALPLGSLADVLVPDASLSERAQGLASKGAGEGQAEKAERYGRVSSGQASLGRANDEASSPLNALTGFVSEVGASCAVQGAQLLDALSAAVRQANVTLLAAFVAGGVLAVTVVVAMTVVVRRAIGPHVANLWKRIKIVLVRTGAG